MKAKVSKGTVSSLVGWLVGWLVNRSSYAVRRQPTDCVRHVCSLVPSRKRLVGWLVGLVWWAFLLTRV